VNLAKCALESEPLAPGALITELKVVDVLGDERDQADAVSDELIMEGARVLLDLNKIESHSGDFRNDDPSQSVCHRQVSVQQLKLDHVARELQDLYFRFPCETVRAEALPRLRLCQLLLIAKRRLTLSIARGRVDLHH